MQIDKDYLKVLQNIQKLKISNANLKLRFKDAYNYCQDSFKNNLKLRLEIYYKFLKDMKIVKQPTKENFNIQFENLEQYLNFQDSLIVTNFIVEKIEYIVNDFIQEYIDDVDLKLFEILECLKYINKELQTFKLFCQSIPNYMQIEEKYRIVFRKFFKVNLYEIGNIKFFIGLYSEIIQIFLKYKNEDFYHQSMLYEKEMRQKTKFQQSYIIFREEEDLLLENEQKEFQNYPDLLILIVKQHVQQNPIQFQENRAILLLLKLVALISDKMYMLPKDNIRKLKIIFNSAKNQSNLEVARNKTTEILVKEILLNNLKHFSILIPNYLNFYSYRDEISDIIFNDLCMIFESISDQMPESKYSILKHLEDQNQNEIKPQKDIFLDFFFMEAKQYLIILKFISFKIQSLEQDEIWLDINNQTEIVYHFLEIEKCIKKFELYSEIKTFFFLKKQINLDLDDKFQELQQSQLYQQLDIKLSLVKKNKYLKLEQLISEILNYFNFIKSDDILKQKKTMIVHFLIQLTNHKDLLHDVQQLACLIIYQLKQQKQSLQHKIEQIWNCLEKFVRRTESIQQISQNFLMIAQDRYLYNRIYRYLTRKNAGTSNNFLKNLEITFFKKQEIKSPQETVLQLEKNDWMNTGELRKKNSEKRRKSLIGTVEPIISLIDIYYEYQNHQHFKNVLKKLESYDMTKNEQEFFVNFKTNFVNFMKGWINFSFGYDFLGNFILSNYQQDFFIEDLYFEKVLQILKLNKEFYYENKDIKILPKYILKEIRKNFQNFCFSLPYQQKLQAIQNIFSLITDSLYRFNIKKDIGADDFQPYLIYALFYSCPKRFVSNLNLMFFFGKAVKQNQLLDLQLNILKVVVFKIIKSDFFQNDDLNQEFLLNIHKYSIQNGLPYYTDMVQEEPQCVKFKGVKIENFFFCQLINQKLIKNLLQFYSKVILFLIEVTILYYLYNHFQYFLILCLTNQLYHLKTNVHFQVTILLNFIQSLVQNLIHFHKLLNDFIMLINIYLLHL